MSTRALVFDAELLTAVEQEFKSAKTFRLAVALVSMPGVSLLLEGMRGCLSRKGRGELILGVDLPSHPDALERLMTLRDEFPNQLTVRRFKSPAARWFHPKLYIFTPPRGRRRAVAGSSNMTGGGLKNNYEASLWSDDAVAVARLMQYFQELHDGGHAVDISKSWLNAYRILWNERQQTQEEAERTRDVVRTIEEEPRSPRIPDSVRGHKFVFTGRLTSGLGNADSILTYAVSAAWLA